MDEGLELMAHAAGFSEFTDLRRRGVHAALLRFAAAVAEDCAQTAELVPRQRLLPALAEQAGYEIAQTIRTRWPAPALNAPNWAIKHDGAAPAEGWADRPSDRGSGGRQTAQRHA